MKIALFNVFLFSYFVVNAQCNRPTTTTTTTTTYSSDNDWSYSGSDDDYDDDDDSYSTEIDFSEMDLLVGGGIHMGFLPGIHRKSDARQITEKNFVEPWNFGERQWFIDFTAPSVSSRRHILIGSSLYINNLWSESAKNWTAPGTAFPGANTVKWHPSTKFTTMTQQFYADVELFGPSLDFYPFVRVEAGYTGYSMMASLEHNDTCGCETTTYFVRDSKFSFTGGLGLGLTMRVGPMELKPIIGYRVYDPRGIRSKAEVEQWQYHFDEVGHDFAYYPLPDRFTMSGQDSAPRMNRLAGVFYFQLGLYVDLGGWEQVELAF